LYIISAIKRRRWQHAACCEIDGRAKHCPCGIPALYGHRGRGFLEGFGDFFGCMLWWRPYSKVLKIDEGIDFKKLVEIAIGSANQFRPASPANVERPLADLEYGRLTAIAADTEHLEMVHPTMGFSDKHGLSPDIKGHTLSAAPWAVGHDGGHSRLLAAPGVAAQ
jgi:hypothetical protein